ncbi:MAG: PEP-CTERM sorting domain-containing protein [Pseudomonadota bacterium]
MFQRHVLCFVAAVMTASAAQAATSTVQWDGGMVEADRYTSDMGGLSFTYLGFSGGRISWQFSPQFVSAINITRASVGEVTPADLTQLYRTNASGIEQLASAVMDAPATSLTGEFGDGHALIMQVASVGGVTLSTLKNSTTNGVGFLQISNLQLDLSRGAVLADISGANGVGSLSGFHLWDYTEVTGPTHYAPPDFSFLQGPDRMAALEVRGSNGFKGLFATAQGLGLIAQALNLNSGIGARTLRAVNDPTLVSGAGFGALTLDFSVTMTGPVAVSLPVPEPSAQAMMVLGGLGVAWCVRRRRVGQATT